MSRITPYNSRLIKRDNNEFPTFSKFIDEFFNDGLSNISKISNDTFKIDIRENEKQYTIEAELAGINKEDILLNFNDHTLTIEVNSVKEEDNSKGDYIHRERHVNSMVRSFYLDKALSENISATFSNGVLEIIVPKNENLKKQSKIEIK